MEFFPHVTEQLRFYVYLYVHPRTEQIFYVGKGTGNRCFAHLYDQSETEKVRVIQELNGEGLQPRIIILRHNLDEATAFTIESVVTDLLNRSGARLTNLVRGQGSEEFGFATIDELNARYGAPEVQIDDSVLLIRISRSFPLCTSDLRLYEHTRGIWVARRSQRQTRYVCAVYAGVVREVYEVEGWTKAGTIGYLKRPELHSIGAEDADRWEFIGRVAEDTIREKYRFKAVRQYLRRGNPDPCVVPRNQSAR